MCLLPHPKLIEWSAALGSDITFFLSQGTAFCTGRGEIITPQPPVGTGTPVTICKPSVGLSTPAVFKSLNYDLLRHDMEPQALLDDFKKSGVVQATSYVNDLEPPAFINLPELQQLKEELTSVHGFSHVMMSGSGTSIFCIGQPSDKVSFEEKFGSREGLQIFYSEFINRLSDETWYERP
jgi:4-diphosphocytidyl-2-C-methyl-D-erythritol kinase